MESIIKIKHNITGKELSYDLDTRAGAYIFATKHLLGGIINYSSFETEDTNALVHLALTLFKRLVSGISTTYYFNYNTASRDKTAIDLFIDRNIVSLEERNLLFTMTNFVRLRTGGNYVHKSKAFCLDGYWFPIEYKKYTNICSNCQSRYFDQDLLDANGIDFQSLPTHLVGRGEECRECTNDYICDDCGRICNDLTHIIDTNNYVCEECLSNYYYCEHCGDYFSSDSFDSITTDDGNHYCCENCAEREGYHYSERRDEWTSDEEYDLMLPYHEMDFCKVGEMPKNAKHWLGNGIEVEVCGDDPSNKYTFWDEIIRGTYLHNGKYGELTEDGSVDLELVTQPMTEKEFEKFDFEGMFRAIADKNYTSHDNTSCGQHIHYSAWYLGYNINQMRQSAKKIAYLFNKYWDDMVKISRRTPEQLEHWCMKPIDNINKNTKWLDLCDTRYFAVNMQHINANDYGTIEIRIPRGTLNASTMRATVDFFRHIVRNAKTISWKNVDNLKLWFKGIKNQNTIDYIKSRNAFNGEF